MAATGGRRWPGSGPPWRPPLGQLVAGGLLDVDQVQAVLLAAALEAGNPQTKALATIKSGLLGGAAKPRRRRDGAA